MTTPEKPQSDQKPELLKLENTKLTPEELSKLPFFHPKEIEHMMEGTIRMINLCQARDVEAVVFLDKSARLPAHLFSKTWDLVCTGREKPNIVYLNIGDVYDTNSEWDKFHDTSHDEDLRKAYSPYLEGRRVLVADEYVDSGSSIDRAGKVIKRLFPETPELSRTQILKKYPNRSKAFVEQAMGVMEREYPTNNPKAHGGYTVVPYDGDIFWEDLLNNLKLPVYRYIPDNVKKFVQEATQTSTEQSRKAVQEVREELKYLAGLIAQRVERVDPEDPNQPDTNPFFTNKKLRRRYANPETP